MKKFRFWKNIIIGILFVISVILGVMYLSIGQMLGIMCILILFSIIDQI